MTSQYNQRKENKSSFYEKWAEWCGNILSYEHMKDIVGGWIPQLLMIMMNKSTTLNGVMSVVLQLMDK